MKIFWMRYLVSFALGNNHHAIIFDPGLWGNTESQWECTGLHQAEGKPWLPAFAGMTRGDSL